MADVPLVKSPVPLDELAGAGAAAAGNVPTSDGAGGVTWATPTAGDTAPLLHVRDEKASGTAGGSITAGSWYTRDLNTVKTNEITGASLASNEITLPAGTFECDARVPAFRTNSHKARLYNTTGAATLLVGSSEYAGQAGNYGTTWSAVRGRFTLASSSVIRIEHRASVGGDVANKGLASSYGEVEVYAEIQIRQIA